MKRKVIYVKALTPLEVGESARVIPLNHSSDLVLNGHACITSPVQNIAPNGTTFSTLNSIYQLADEPDKVEEVKDNKVVTV